MVLTGSFSIRGQMNAIIVSDLHLGSRFFLGRVFERFIKNISNEYDIILNGDILDNPYEKLKISHQRILDLIKQTSYKQTVVWVRGNHDNGYVLKEFGKIVFKRFYSLGHRLLIVHGDDFDKIMPKTQLFIKVFSLMHELRLRLGARPVHVAHYAKKWAILYNFLRNHVMVNAVNCAMENGYEAVTCGHTHYPEDTLINGIRYINTGAWTEAPTYYLLVTADALTLKKIETG
jgi:UDP-2,3-diacylglucosamine pyrophosphatase LpxH